MKGTGASIIEGLALLTI